MTMDSTGEPDKLNFATLFTSFKGRIRRQHFWIGFIIMIVVAVVISMLPKVVAVIGSFLILWPMAALYIKRGHDMGKPDTFSYIPIGLSVISTLISAVWKMQYEEGYKAATMAGDTSAIFSGPGSSLMLISTALGLIGLIFLIWYGAADGEPRPNQWGPNPKGINS